MSDQSQGSPSRAKHKERDRRGPVALDTLGRPVLAAHGSIAVDVESQQAMRRQITEGLPRINRSFDPNRIVLEIPPGFQPPQTLPEKGKGPEVVQGMQTRSSSSMSSRDLSHVSSEKPANERAMTISARIGDASNSLALGLASSSPMTVLGASRIDPFANYPIKMNEGELWLIDQGNHVF